MPELPEVETVCRGLKQVMVGQTITDVKLHRHSLRYPLPPYLPETLIGRTITDVQRRAKYYLIHFDKGPVLLGHLGMSGSWHILPHPAPSPEKHDHVELILPQHILRYNDPRRFGMMDLCLPSELASHPAIKLLGPEPLSADFNLEYFQSACHRRTAPIKQVIMDQAVVVGVGNIYASESLFLAHIDPRRSACDLSTSELQDLLVAIQKTLTIAIDSGGSSLRNYQQPSGELGYFQHQWAVYGRQDQPCPGCDCNTGISMIRQGGRATFFCAKKQK